MSVITPERYTDFGKTRILIEVTFLKHFALEVWVSIFIYLRVSKYIDVPAYARRLIKASAFPPVFTLRARRSSMGWSMFSGFDLPKPI